MSSSNFRIAFLWSAAVASLSLFGAACGGDKAPEGAAPSATSAPAEQAPAAQSARLQGAGASFPAPLYTRWFKAYSSAHPGVQIDYQSVGSGSGIKAVIDNTVDFGASDAAMTAEEIGRVQGGVQLLPLTAGSIVLAYNLEGVSELKLSRDAYTGIFLGKVKSWDDPAIAKTNPGVKLPKLPINVVVRADSSGTTFVFTQHLSEVSADFAKSPGVNKMPNWPVGTRSKGNEGVTASLKTTPGSIGYVEYGYAVSQKMPFAQLENKAGKYVTANTTTGQAALESVKFDEHLIGWAPDPEGEQAYPIATYTWLILYRQYKDQTKVDTLRDLLKYTLNEGQKEAEPLGYIPLPTSTVTKVTEALSSVTVAGN